MTQVNTQQVVIVGLDIGHGECAATYFRVNEGKSWNPLALTQNKDHVIPSAIYYGADGSITIGKAAAANHDSISYFKRPPSQWDGPVEAHEDLTHRQCMMDFIRTLFADIVTYNRNDGINDGDEIHLLVGCPSSGSWLAGGAREAYEGLIREATGVAHVTVVPESRGAIFNSFAGGELKDCSASQGVSVFDFGSLTADFTYIQMGKYMLERSWDLGASNIEMCMLKRMLRAQDMTVGSIYEGQLYDLLYFLRTQKEMYFSGEMGLYADPSLTVYETDEDGERIPNGVTKRGTPKYLTRRIGLPDADMDEFMEKVTGEESFPVRENGAILGQFSWETGCEGFFLTMKRMLDERELPCRAVVLTGGASHMPFVTEIAQRVFEGCAVVREQNPSITVARGLSIIGDTDLRAPQLLEGLVKEIEAQGLRRYDELINIGCAEPMANKAFQVMMEYLRTIERDITVGELKTGLTARMEAAFTQDYVCTALDAGITAWAGELVRTITEETNKKVEELYHGQVDTEGFQLEVSFLQDVFSSGTSFQLDAATLLKNIDLTGMAVQVISAVLGVIVLGIILLVLGTVTLGLALVLGLVVELMRNVIVDAYAKNEKRVLKLSQIRTIISTLEKPDKRAKQLADLKTMFTKQLRTTYNSCPETEQQLRRTLNEAADRAFGIISLKYFAVESVLED